MRPRIAATSTDLSEACGAASPQCQEGRGSAHARRTAGFAEVAEDAHDYGALGDEGDQLQVSAAASAA